MARKVFVSSDISHDEKLLDVAEMDPTAALLWPWLLTVFDDWGRARAEPRRLKVQVFPGNDLVTVDVISRTLALLRDASLIILYENGGQYMAVDPEVWFKWQTHIRKEKREDDSGSKWPSPPDSREIAENREKSRDRTPSPTPSPSREAKASREPLKNPPKGAAAEELAIHRAFEDLFGVPANTDLALRRKLAKSLLAADATPTQVAQRAAAWKTLFPPNGGRPGPTLTPTALEKHWGQLGTIAETPEPFNPETCPHPDDRRAVFDDVAYCGACRKELAAT